MPSNELCDSNDLLLRQQWQQLARTHDDGARGFLVEHYLPLVRATAQRLRARLPSCVDVEDLASAGTFGLMDAMESFDPRRGVRFETFCVMRIRGAILDELRATDWAPRLVRSRFRALSGATDSLEAELGRPPTETELAHRLQVSSRKLQGLQRDVRTPQMTSLDRGLSESDSGRRETQASLLADKTAEDPSSQVMRDDLREILVRGLRRTERQVLLLYYYEQLTMKEIGLALDLSESRVSQIHSAVLRRLRVQLQERSPELLEDLVGTANSSSQLV
jgi:RNA polymerase sigma factor FliA